MTENPYEPPPEDSEPRASVQWFSKKSIGGIILLVTMFPAAGIACFTICVAVADRYSPNNPTDYTGAAGALMTGAAIGAICAAALFGAMLTGAILLLRRPAKRPRIWTSTAGTTVRATLVVVDGFDVVLRREDGTELRVKWKQLSKADRDWLKGKA